MEIVSKRERMKPEYRHIIKRDEFRIILKITADLHIQEET
ncbi:hypothetical protein N399_17605 [Bacillus licheniformis CG-B52]|nr:hypothetical protein MUY_003348 [Bacillus licheniformis WX-02]EQM26641.1 hypothetical protein N399_17605 [Bacillus licheniformis CG-B52]KUL07400.1 hypothetical protein LI17339_19470 [Bacillus licheniformis LMG 17339]